MLHKGFSTTYIMFWIVSALEHFVIRKITQEEKKKSFRVCQREFYRAFIPISGGNPAVKLSGFSYRIGNRQLIALKC